MNMKNKCVLCKHDNAKPCEVGGARWWLCADCEVQANRRRSILRNAPPKVFEPWMDQPEAAA